MQIDLTDLRRRLGTEEGPISQAALGELLGGLSQATVSRMETGDLKPRGLVRERLVELHKAHPILSTGKGKGAIRRRHGDSTGRNPLRAGARLP